MHADACTTGRHHLRDLRKRQKRHALEERADLGMLFKLLLVHDGELRRTGHEHRKQIALLMIRILPVEVLPVVLDDSLDGKIVQELLKLLALKPTRAFELLERERLAHLHVCGERRLFFGHHARKSPIIGVGRSHLHANAVGDLLAFTQHAFLKGLMRSRTGIVRLIRFVWNEGVVFRIELFGDDTMRFACRVRFRNDIASLQLLLGKTAAHGRLALFYRRTTIGLLYLRYFSVFGLLRHRIPLAL